MGARPEMETDYSVGPVVVFWEITRSCALACVHCRATAQPKRHPLELTTQESFELVDELRRFEPNPILVISGGDPLMRPDLFEIASYASAPYGPSSDPSPGTPGTRGTRGTGKRMRVSLSPSVTALVTPKNLRRVKESGISHLSFSLDGPDAGSHDSFRGVAGSFARTLVAVRDAQEAGLTVQLNTTVTRRNAGRLSELGALVDELGAVMWDVFFLVITGRAASADLMSPDQHEEAFNWLRQYGEEAPFRVKTTLGQPYRRVMLQSMGEGADRSRVPSTNDGKGICFISHVGQIHPSGFLPVDCGNVRTDSLVETYRNHPVFTDLRDPSKLEGKCGSCPFNAVCGGCRARAYGLTGNYLAADPTCPYEPAA